jgi:hypothetical protein
MSVMCATNIQHHLRILANALRWSKGNKCTYWKKGKNSVTITIIKKYLYSDYIHGKFVTFYTWFNQLRNVMKKTSFTGEIMAIFFNDTNIQNQKTLLICKIKTK